VEHAAATQKWLIAIAVMLGTTIEVLARRRRSQSLCSRTDLLYPSPDETLKRKFLT